MNNTALVASGSLGALAAANKTSIAESFVNAEVVFLVDVSGSMAACDSRGGRARYDVALEELALLQQRNPGKLAIIAFSDSAVFVPYGQPPMLSGGTNLAGALRFARVADVDGMRFVVISDGEPNDEYSALQEAALYRGRIDVVYVGPEDAPFGRQFLSRLANARGGQVVTADRVCELASKTQFLLADRAGGGNFVAEGHE